MYCRVTRAVSMMSCLPMANTLMPSEYLSLKVENPLASTNPSSTVAMVDALRLAMIGLLMPTEPGDVYPVISSTTGTMRIVTLRSPIISGTPPEGATNTTFKVTVSDGSLSQQKTVSLSITPVNDAPQITSEVSVEAVEHQPFTYTATAWDPEGDALFYTFIGHPAWLSKAGAKLSGTPPEGAISFSFKVRASDGSLQDEETVNVILQAVNDAPQITSAATASATEHQQFSYTATATVHAAAGGVDFAAEVWVGRIPVYGGDTGRMDAILRKIMDYESAGGTAWRKNVLRWT